MNNQLSKDLAEPLSKVITTGGNDVREGIGIVSDGCVSTEGGALLVENSHFIGVSNPLDNNKKSASKKDYTGKIRADRLWFQLDETDYYGSSEDANSPITISPADKIEFSWNTADSSRLFDYEYTTVDPREGLKEMLLGEDGCGAGKLTWSSAKWLSTGR